ncbi:MAG: hypothetical protein F9K31_10100 [Dokdonella sp.]|nr:MAG: hypothetical protein F9K31_10100 [Dokdonella sp.]
MQARVQELEATGLARAWRAGGESARAALGERVHANVRALVAQAQRSFPGVAGEATSLAPAAVRRMLDALPAGADHLDFFRATAQTTRQILVEAARRRLADARGEGPVERARAPAHAARAGADADLLRIDAALRDLQCTDARRAEVFELVHFGRFGLHELAQALQRSEADIDHDLRLVRAWLGSVPTA